jgi:DNA-binding transcriptional LysR family regulator
MDILTMQYYLAVTREGTISAAAAALHVAQPSLSRQMKELEAEVGATLFVRGNRRITLTEEGMVLRRRAEEMVQLMQLTRDEITMVKNHVSGSIRIGAGESHAFHYLSRTASALAAQHPDIRFHVTSGDTQDLMDELNNGLIDFALLFSEPDHTLYQSIELPEKDTFGVLMPKDCPLAEKSVVSLADLKGKPMIVSRASIDYMTGTDMLSGLHVAATYNLLYNASLMVEDGLGYALCFDKLIHTGEGSPLTFRPLDRTICVAGTLIWKKYQVFTPAAKLFIDLLRETAGKT